MTEPHLHVPLSTERSHNGCHSLHVMLSHTHYFKGYIIFSNAPIICRASPYSHHRLHSSRKYATQYHSHVAQHWLNAFLPKAGPMKLLLQEGDTSYVTGKVANLATQMLYPQRGDPQVDVSLPITEATLCLLPNTSFITLIPVQAQNVHIFWKHEQKCPIQNTNDRLKKIISAI